MTKGPANTQSRLEERIGELAERYAQLLRAGKAPDVEQYARDYPDVAEVLRQILPALKFMGETAPDAPAAAGDNAGHERGVIGDYRIVREAGRGGMGIVCEAEQTSLSAASPSRSYRLLPRSTAAGCKDSKTKPKPRRSCTIKISCLFTASAATEACTTMRCTEGQSLAQVLVDVLNLETSSAKQGAAMPSIAQTLSSDGSVGEQLDSTGDALTNVHRPQKPDPIPRRETRRTPQAAISTKRSTNKLAYYRNVAALGIQAAEALDHAHVEGVIHRDIKPSNLILDERGKLWITDFGLARVESDVGLTMTGDIIGTLRYMSPEQILGY